MDILDILNCCWCILCYICHSPRNPPRNIVEETCQKLRKETGDSRYRSFNELQIRSFGEVAKTSLLRPFVLLSELIVFLMTIYMAICYGLLYMFFFAYPVVYQQGKGWSASLTGVMFIPIGVGVIIATIAAPFFNKDYNRRAQVYRDRGELPPPELRLIPMMIACWFVPVGLLHLPGLHTLGYPGPVHAFQDWLQVLASAVCTTRPTTISSTPTNTTLLLH